MKIFLKICSANNDHDASSLHPCSQHHHLYITNYDSLSLSLQQLTGTYLPPPHNNHKRTPASNKQPGPTRSNPILMAILPTTRLFPSLPLAISIFMHYLTMTQLLSNAPTDPSTSVTPGGSGGGLPYSFPFHGGRGPQQQAMRCNNLI